VEQVLPSAEICGGAEPLDEDCDGEVNEDGADCVCGDGHVSNGEECDDKGLTNGDGCSAECEVEAVVMAAGGLDHTCVLLSSGVIKCWGDNGSGQLGLGDEIVRGDDPNEMGSELPVVDLGPGEKATAVVAGLLHTCALLDGGRVKCWGENEDGQLGLGDVEDRGDNPSEMGANLPVINLGAGVMVKSITAGDYQTCALTTEGKVKCWGWNQEGGLGLGDSLNRGDGPGEMGDSLPYVNLGLGLTVVTSITSGARHTCALLDDESVKCWGWNYRGQLGQGDTKNQGDQPNEMGPGLGVVNLGGGVQVSAIYAASYHTCAVLKGGGSMKCWGYNSDGELSQGDAITRGDNPGEMGNALAPVSFGAGTTAVAIVGGEGHSCAVLSDGNVKCWGWNHEGQLGLGDIESRGDSPNETVDKLPAVSLGAGLKAVAISAGDHSTCAVLSDGGIKCWGSNNYGELGLGNTKHRGDNPDEMGDNLPEVMVF
jgi:cysteine-rich repeat protein